MSVQERVAMSLHWLDSSDEVSKHTKLVWSSNNT